LDSALPDAEPGDVESEVKEQLESAKTRGIIEELVCLLNHNSIALLNPDCSIGFDYPCATQARLGFEKRRGPKTVQAGKKNAESDRRIDQGSSARRSE
jgi:hypothetical protein